MTSDCVIDSAFNLAVVDTTVSHCLSAYKYPHAAFHWYYSKLQQKSSMTRELQRWITADNTVSDPDVEV